MNSIVTLMRSTRPVNPQEDYILERVRHGNITKQTLSMQKEECNQTVIAYRCLCFHSLL